MRLRIPLVNACSPRCPSCDGCRNDSRVPTLREVVESIQSDAIVLGGGDATQWPHLGRLLKYLKKKNHPVAVWVEAPSASFAREGVLEALAGFDVVGLVVQMDSPHAENWVFDDELAVVERAEAAGLQVEIRVCTRPRHVARATELATRLAPRPVALELTSRTFAGDVGRIDSAALDALIVDTRNITFTGFRRVAESYLPPCALANAWQVNPRIWRGVLAPPETVSNDTLPICAQCTLRTRCQWSAAELLDEAAAASLAPVGNATALQRDRRPEEEAELKKRLAAVRLKRTQPEVICTTPWTTVEMVEPNGTVYQCCMEWTHGNRGKYRFGDSLLELWNGDGYQQARAHMLGKSRAKLCREICPRLHDGKFSESRFKVQPGAEPFVRNQLDIAEDIALGRTEVRGRPLHLAICPSTYCNYDCIMCDCGRTPRRDMPESIWEEVDELLPTLAHISLLGGEPLANPGVLSFLRRFDRADYPDALVNLVTNGALMTPRLLKHLGQCHFGSVTLSLNAGTPDVYEQVQRGLALEDVLSNLDALLEFRKQQPYHFGICVSFVAMPANVHTLIPFGEIAKARGLDVRVLPLSLGGAEDLDYYTDEAEIERVLSELQKFATWTTRNSLPWLEEIRATAEATRAEGARRLGGGKRAPVPVR